MEYVIITAIGSIIIAIAWWMGGRRKKAQENEPVGWRRILGKAEVKYCAVVGVLTWIFWGASHPLMGMAVFFGFPFIAVALLVLAFIIGICSKDLLRWYGLGLLAVICSTACLIFLAVAVDNFKKKFGWDYVNPYILTLELKTGNGPLTDNRSIRFKKKNDIIIGSPQPPQFSFKDGIKITLSLNREDLLELPRTVHDTLQKEGQKNPLPKGRRVELLGNLRPLLSVTNCFGWSTKGLDSKYPGVIDSSAEYRVWLEMIEDYSEANYITNP